MVWKDESMRHLFIGIETEKPGLLGWLHPSKLVCEGRYTLANWLLGSPHPMGLVARVAAPYGTGC